MKELKELQEMKELQELAAGSYTARPGNAFLPASEVLQIKHVSRSDEHDLSDVSLCRAPHMLMMWPLLRSIMPCRTAPMPWSTPMQFTLTSSAHSSSCNADMRV